MCCPEQCGFACRRGPATPFTPEASGPAAAAAAGLPRSSGGPSTGPPGAGPPGDVRARMTLLDGQDNVVELEKSNVLLLGPTGAPLGP